jgi:hypothetical protein
MDDKTRKAKEDELKELKESEAWLHKKLSHDFSDGKGAVTIDMQFVQINTKLKQVREKIKTLEEELGK